MNTVIQELAEQAAEFAVTNPIDLNLESESEDQKITIPSTFIEKFAELMVQECATVCQNIDKEYDGEDVLATWCATEIKKHFGVEE